MKPLLTSLLLAFCLSLSGQTPNNETPAQKAVLDLYAQMLVFPQEKIYVQTDKPYYISGEKIFFRAFVLHASARESSEISRYVYVELVSANDTVSLRQQIRMDDEMMFYGALSLPEALPQGNYRIRAYTRYMENTGEAYFYTRPVFIADPRNKETDELQVKSPNKSSNKEEPFEITFYPEGGNLISGQSNRLAFKALLPDGSAAEIKGTVFNAQNEEAATFATEHEGMGVFTIQPETGGKYYAQCTCQDQTIKVNLPEAKTNICSLQALWKDNRLSVSVRKPESSPEQKFYLLMHRQGIPTYLEEWDFSKGSKEWDKSEFASGVSHLMLLTDAFQVVSERLIFAYNNDAINAEIQTNQQSYKPREQVVLDFQLSEMEEDTIPATFAISVTDDKDIKIDTTTNILAELLLVSELEGQIRYPAWYFLNDDEKTVQAADLLMLTHGWRRYHVAEALQGNFQKPEIKPEVSQSFTGILKGRTGKPFKEGKIKILCLDYHFSEVVQADEKGRYVFDNFEFPDSTTYSFVSYSDKKTTEVDIIPDLISYPSINIPTVYPENEKLKLENPDFATYVAKADKKYVNENGMREIILKEVTVKASKITKFERLDNHINLPPNKSITPDKIEEFPPITFEELFSRISGVMVTPGEVTLIRNGMGFVYVVNGIPFNGDFSDLSATISIQDIAQVDVYTDPASVLFFNIHGSPVIALTTWPPGMDRYRKQLYKNSQILTPLGYQKPVEFYAPKYDTPERINSDTTDLRSTIYWKPNVLVDDEDEASLEFYTADTPSTYSVVIEGIGRHKTLIYHRENALIKVEK
jgi:hypothetical protein